MLGVMRRFRFPSRFLPALLLVGAIAACTSNGSADDSAEHEGATRAAPPAPEGKAVAIFAGGCFWCMEKPFERLDGVESVLSGYAGGQIRGPSYDRVSSGSTGHTEAVRVLYDPDATSYDRLLEVFWHNVDPFDRGGQFCDRGSQYRPAIFPVSTEQRRAAKRSKARIEKKLDKKVAVDIEQTDAFWVAEDYHQNFYRTHPVRYRSYRSGCGRDARLREVWGDEAGH